MAVFRRRYQGYVGPLTARRWRFLVPTRYALEELLRSRALFGFAALALVPLLVETSVLYLYHHPTARVLLGLMKLTELVRVDAGFFVQALSTQSFFGFVLAAWLGPTLVAGDLANGAMPLYLSRPFSRLEYVLGKVMVILVIGSVITWLPVLMLYSINSAMAGGGWWHQHLNVASGLIVGGVIWCTVVSLFVLSLSAWIKWRLLASSILLGLYLASSGLGEALVAALHLPWGRLLNLGHAFRMIWTQLVSAPSIDPAVPVLAAWLMVSSVGAISSYILARRVRAREVIG